MRFEPDSFFVVCPSERAYLDGTGKGWVRATKAKAGVFTRQRARELLASVEWPYGKRYLKLVRARVCACCGKHGHQAILTEVDAGPPRQWRCDRHVGRNPCLVEGCARTRAARRPSLSTYICGFHWKMVPRKMRLVYYRLWRLERKSGGWTDSLVARYWRIWPRIAAVATKRARGDVDLDLAEIERLLGL